MRGESRSGKFGAFGQGGLPGVAWVRSGGWLQLGPGRGRRDGGARVPHLEVVRHGPPPTSTGLTTNGGGLGVGCPEEAGLRRGPYARWDDGRGWLPHPVRVWFDTDRRGRRPGSPRTGVVLRVAGTPGSEDGRVGDSPLRRFVLVVLGGFVEGFGAEGHEVVAVAGGPFLGGGRGW